MRTILTLTWTVLTLSAAVAVARADDVVAETCAVALVPDGCVVGPRTTRTIIRSCTAGFGTHGPAQPELECVVRQLARVCDVRLD